MSSGLSTQNLRLIRLTTALGDDVLIPKSVSYSATVGSDFNLGIMCFSEVEHDLALADIVATEVTIELILQDNSSTFLKGYVQSVQATSAYVENTHSQYRLSVNSWFKMLGGARSNSRIFQDMSIPDVVESVLGEYGGSVKYQLQLKRSYNPWRYLVQYDETDYDFVVRLLALEGITFYFEHTEDAHTLTILDDASFIADLSQSPVFLQPHTQAHDSFSSWSRSGSFTSGVFELGSYNYQQPSSLIDVSKSVSSPGSDFAHSSESVVYRYTGHNTTAAEAQAQADALAYKASSGVETWNGGGSVRHMALARNFAVALPDGAPHPDDGKTFTSMGYTLSADDTNGQLSCGVTAVLSGGLFFPEAKQPQISSLLTAQVVGKPGEEIQTDELGRVKVCFHWDRSGLTDGQNTCFLRVMQGFASSGFGLHFTPRVGDEVVVAFEGGNPDRPFIIGSLYNAENLPPYADYNGVRAGVRTRSTMGGAADTCNELYFDDAKGKEEVYFQSEKDYKQYVKNDSTTKIDNDRTSEVGNNSVDHIINDSSVKIDNNLTTEIGKDENRTIGSNLTTKIGSNGVFDAGSELTLQVGGSVIKISGSKIEISSSQVVINGSQVTLN